MKASTQAIAQRMINADENFVTTVQEIAECSPEQAIKVLNIYRLLKVIKLDVTIGRWKAKHGAFMEAEPMWNAINFDEAELMKKEVENA